MYDRGKVLLGIALFVAGVTYPVWRGLLNPPRPATADGEPVETYVDPSLKPPKFHEPLARWRAYHPFVIHRGERTRYQCVLCHDPERHCDQCHSYVGVRDLIDRPVALPPGVKPAPKPRPASPPGKS